MQFGALFCFAQIEMCLHGHVHWTSSCLVDYKGHIQYTKSVVLMPKKGGPPRNFTRHCPTAMLHDVAANLLGEATVPVRALPWHVYYPDSGPTMMVLLTSQTQISIDFPTLHLCHTTFSEGFCVGALLFSIWDLHKQTTVKCSKQYLFRRNTILQRSLIPQRDAGHFLARWSNNKVLRWRGIQVALDLGPNSAKHQTLDVTVDSLIKGVIYVNTPYQFSCLYFCSVEGIVLFFRATWISTQNTLCGYQNEIIVECSGHPSHLHMKE